MLSAVFADTFYWLALARPRDPWHTAAWNWTIANAAAKIVTTDEVFLEFLNGMSKSGPGGRGHAAATVLDARHNPHVDVLPQTRIDFDAALAMYHSRLDKEYRLVDCRSMLAMQSLGLTEVLSNDHHFTREGFTVLFP